MSKPEMVMIVEKKILPAYYGFDRYLVF